SRRKNSSHSCRLRPHPIHPSGLTPLSIELALVHSGDDFEDAVLRSRAGKAPQLATICLLRASVDGVEAALVLLDIHPQSEAVILYELFLCSALRGRGIGTRLL